MCALDIYSEVMLCRLYEISTINSVGIDSSDPSESHDKHRHKSARGFRVVSVGRSGGCLQYVTAFIGYYVAFQVFDFHILSIPFCERGRSTRELSL